jgi:hypothetical protein
MRLLTEVATKGSEADGRYQFNSYDIGRALWSEAGRWAVVRPVGDYGHEIVTFVWPAKPVPAKGRFVNASIRPLREAAIPMQLTKRHAAACGIAWLRSCRRWRSGCRLRLTLRHGCKRSGRDMPGHRRRE